MVTMENILARRAEILRIAAEHGAHHVRLFGSLVRGQAGAGSDVDLLVRLDAGCSLIDHVALIQDLEDLLGVRVDVVPEDALNRTIRDDVLNEAVAI
jgi:predicted nucleotidyltransferase